MNEVTTDLSEKFGRKSIDDVLEPSRVPEDVFGKGDLVLEGGGGGEREWRKEERANRRRELLEDFEEASLPLEMNKEIRSMTEPSSILCEGNSLLTLAVRLRASAFFPPKDRSRSRSRSRTTARVAKV